MLLVLILQTGHVTPQCHIVFDECFSVVESEEHQPQTWDDLFKYTNKSWNQFEEFEGTELSSFEREELEQTIGNINSTA